MRISRWFKDAFGPPAPLGRALLDSGTLSADDLARALEIQRRSGERLGRVIVGLGLVPRRTMYRALAAQWRRPFVELPSVTVDPEIARLVDLEDAIRGGWLPIARDNGVIVVATCERPSADLERKVGAALGTRARFRFVVTTDWDIAWAMRTVRRDAMLDRATHGLRRHNPKHSAHTVLTPWQFIATFSLVVGFAFFTFRAPRATAVIALFTVNLCFIIAVAFKFVLSLLGSTRDHIVHVTDDEITALRDADLPTYTILVPVYREANIVGMLMEHLGHLDYPAEKLEILLLLEEDDTETIEAAKAASPPERVRFLLIPQGLPKTKPKACNVGLFFARGEYLVIYDAEDRPDADQLKRALVAFARGDDDLVCVQAALNYFNAEENILTRLFTLEYSFWFDYMLPGLERLQLPMPLGGTSNHFRTDKLRELGGWDPFNVTEDADLGVRAAALGYRVGIVHSTTFEEANSRLGNWIRQRSRWIKGYMQTSLVHLRHPITLCREIGVRQVLGFSMLIGGTAAALVVAPLMWLLYAAWLWRPEAVGSLFPPIVMYPSLFNLLFGNGLMIYVAMLAVFRRRQYHLIGFALLTPVYWALQSVAAYKALWQLFTRPYYWEKTEHGLSRQLPTAAGAPVNTSV